MKNRSVIFGAMVALGLSTAVQAEPTLYPPDVRVLSRITNNTDSNIIADEVDPNTIWVMPPNTASAKVTGLHSLSANVVFCREMKDLSDNSKELTGEIQNLARKKLAKLGELQALDARASKLMEEAEAFAASRNLQQLAELDGRLTSMETRLTELYQTAESCTKGCDGVQQEINDLNKAKQEALKERNRLSRENSADVREYTRKAAVAKAARATYKNAKSVFDEIADELGALRDRFRALFANYGGMIGGSSGFRYTSAWNDNIKRLRDENPGINFSKIMPKNTKVTTQMLGVKDIDGRYGMIPASLGGELKDGVALFPAYPESLSANVNLSVLGVCPILHPDDFDIPTEHRNGIQNYGLIITYDYDSVYRVQADVTYNMYKMYQKIVSSGSSGGLFSSRSWTNVEEHNFFRDSFSVQWSDKENTLTQAEKDARETEMRHAVLERLASLALPTAPNRVEVLAAAAPPPHGAVVISCTLMNACPGNVYCVAGAAVFQVLDAIFGSSSTTASYTNITDIAVTERYSNAQKITKSGLTSYL